MDKNNQYMIEMDNDRVYCFKAEYYSYNRDANVYEWYASDLNGDLELVASVNREKIQAI